MVSKSDENGYKRQVPSETIHKRIENVQDICGFIDELEHLLVQSVQQGLTVAVTIQQELPKAANALKKSKVA